MFSFFMLYVFFGKSAIIIHTVINNCASVVLDQSAQSRRSASLPCAHWVNWRFDRGDDLIQFGEILVVQSQSAHQFPHSLDGIEIRAVRGKVVERDSITILFAPFRMQLGIMIPGVVTDHLHSSLVGPALRMQLLQEIKESLPIETMSLTSKDETAIAQPHGPKIAHTLTRRVMQYHRIFHLGRNPHPIARTVLAEMDLIQSPQVHTAITRQILEFFYASSDARDRRGQSADEACAGGIPIVGRSVGIAARSSLPRALAPNTPPASCRPTDCRSIRNWLAAAAAPLAPPVPGPRSDSPAVLAARPHVTRLSHAPQSGEPSIRPCVAHRQTGAQRPHNCIPAPPAARRAADGHIVILLNGGSHPAIRAIWSRHRISSVPSLGASFDHQESLSKHRLELCAVSYDRLYNIGILLLCIAAKLTKVSSPIIDCLAFFILAGYLQF